jgi:N-acetylglucosamine kinase-like BadF-type ATPase
MILIVESGSTKADWVLLDSTGIKLSFKTKGWNIMLLDELEMSCRLNRLTDLNPFKDYIKEVYFYTSGASILSSVLSLNQLLKTKFINANVFVESDLLAAARSAYNGKPLFVSILGTGSNTAFYDGEELVQSTPSLGYILGDEGSGARLGKSLLKAYLYKTLPATLFLTFSKENSISKENVLKAVYTQQSPNKFLASYVPFLVANKNHEFVKSLVKDEFKSYFKIHLNSNVAILDFPICFIGSIAFLFQDTLKDLCKEYSIKESRYIQSPLNGLVAYHSK